MNTWRSFVLVLTVVLVTVSACAPATPEPTPEPVVADLPYPASVYCEEQGGRVEMRTNEKGVYGVCVFDDGSECDEWAYYRGECKPGDSIREAQEEPTVIDMPNPASVHCEEQGGRLEMRTNEKGVYGVCVFDDGSECDEWAFFRGECKTGDSLATPVPVDRVASEGWQLYRNAELGYSVEYPADAEIVIDDNPLKSISIIGPLVADERWPQITISHPTDRDDYRPPQGSDLQEWLTDHSLLGPDERMADGQIAGTLAIHLRHQRSPQSYAFDRYFFVHAGQLYQIVIGHTGDKEDWELYDHFLQSIRFEE